MNPRHFVPAALAIMISAASLSAQSDPCLRRTVAVNVFDNQERMISSLSQDDFQASLHHERVKVLSVTPGASPRVVIVVDASGSMTGDRVNWDSSLESAYQLARTLNSRVPMGLIAFSTQVDKTIALT